MLGNVFRIFICSALMGLGACGGTEEGGSRSGTSGSGGGDGDASGFDNVGFGNGGAGNGGGTGGYIDPNFSAGCAPKDASVWFVIDGSGSMRNDFGSGGSDRWNALRSALMDPDGAIPRLEGVVDFGVVIYDGLPLDIGAFFGMPAPDLCPQLVTVPVAPTNFAAIDAAYPADALGGSTPTHQAIEATRGLIAAELNKPDVSARSHYIILATDGAPNDNCAGFGLDGAEPLVLEQTSLALSEGIQTFVISLAGGDANLTAHLTQVADAGGTGTAPFVPDSKDALVDTLRMIVGDATGCDLLAPD